MAYFRCTTSGNGLILEVTCDSVFASSTITCSDGTTTLTQTCPSSSPYTVSFKLPNGGEWQVSTTYNNVTYSETATVELEVELTPVPDGSTVTPTDDIQIWLNCANIFDKTTYTTVADVLADTTTLLALISSNNAVDYMVRSTTWASDICANSTAMTYIGADNYCADTLLEDSTWRTGICNSTYFESVLNVKVPTMTSNTAPSGTCFGSSNYSGSNYYQAFDKNTNTIWNSNTASNSNIGYQFTKKISLYKAVLTKRTLSGYDSANFNCNIKGSNDSGSTWQSLDSFNYKPTVQNLTRIISPSTKYNRYALFFGTDSAGTILHPCISELQFYGRTDV